MIARPPARPDCSVSPLAPAHRERGRLPRWLPLAAALSCACVTVERHHAFAPHRVLDAEPILAKDGHAELPDEEGIPRSLSLTEPVTPIDLRGVPAADPEPLSRWLERCAAPTPPGTASQAGAPDTQECLPRGGTLDTSVTERAAPSSRDLAADAVLGGIGAGVAGFVACQASCSPDNRTRADVAGGIGLAALLFAFFLALHLAFRIGD